ncbi:MAG: type II secretion system F family protein [Candidatus Aquicultorales bacterium]
MSYSLILALVFSSVFLVTLSVAIPAAGSGKVRRSIKRLSIYDNVRKPSEVELAQPLVDRVIVPRTAGFKAFVKKHSPRGLVEALKEKLTIAGNPKGLDVDAFLSVKIGSMVVGVALGAVLPFLMRLVFVQGLLVFTAFAVFGFYLPDIWLDLRVRERQKRIRLALTDTLDLLSIALEAGLGFNGALMKIIQNVPGPLSEEFFRAIQEMQMGISRKNALRNLLHRTKVEDLDPFISAIMQADALGMSIGQTLKVQAKEMRTVRMQKAEELAQKAPVKMVFPLIVCIFPALFVVIVGPAAIRIIEVFVVAFRK